MRMRIVYVVHNILSGKTDWGFAPNPTRELSSLDLPLSLRGGFNRLDETMRMRIVYVVHNILSGMTYWGFAPNPTRELSSLDLPLRFAAALRNLLNDAHAHRICGS